MSWLIFDSREHRTRRSKPPQLKLRPEGRIVLNGAAAALLGGSKFVLILWDAERRKLALQPVDSDRGAYKVSRNGRAASVGISAMTALRDIGILPSQPRSFPVMRERGGTLVETSLEAFEG